MDWKWWVIQMAIPIGFFVIIVYMQIMHWIGVYPI